MRSDLRSVLSTQLDSIRETRKSSASSEEIFNLAPDVSVKYGSIENELFIGGVYVSRFLKEPTFNLRDPTTFLELLLQRWGQELELASSNETEKKTDRSSTALIEDAAQDVLEMVTTASVYICKVRDSLCDRLSQWGYVTRCIAFLPEVLRRELFGTPLQSIVRMLHVASNRLSNIETLAISGNSEGHLGFVDLTLQAIGKDTLHPDAAFMVELLKKAFEKALGDLRKARPSRPQTAATSTFQPSVVAPSPAPGDGPVRKRVSAEDDPLGMMQAMGQPPQQHQGFAASPQTQTGQPFYSQQNTRAPPQMQASHQPQSHLSFAERSQLAHQSQQSQSQYQSNMQHRSQPTNIYYPTNVPGVQQQPNNSYQQASSQVYGSTMPPSSSQSHGHPSVPQQSFTSQSQNRYNTGPYQHGQPAQPQAQSQLSYQQRSTLSQQAPQHTPPVQYQPQQQQHYVQSGSGQMHQQYGAGPSSGTQSQMYGSAHQQSPAGHTQQIPNQSTGPQRSMMAGSPGYHNQQSNTATGQQQQTMYYQQNGPNSYNTPQQAHGGGQGQAPQNSGHQMAQQQGDYTQQQWNQSQQPALSQGPPQQYQYQSQAQHQLQHQQPSMPHAPSPQQFQQQQPAPPAGPMVVETVVEDEGSMPQPVPTTTMQYQPPPMEGSGIDARTQPDPKILAEQQTMSVAGAPGAAQGRVALLQQALACELCQTLILHVLENPKLSDIKDPAAAKVHAIDLIKLLTKDPGYGGKFKLILQDIPEWQKYKSQDHSLLITSHEQRADYFLTDGGSGETKKLLTQG